MHRHPAKKNERKRDESAPISVMLPSNVCRAQGSEGLRSSPT